MAGSIKTSRASSTPPFQASSFQASSFQASSFQASSFQASSFQASSFQASSFQASSFQASSFQGSSYPSPSSFQSSSSQQASSPSFQANNTRRLLAASSDENELISLFSKVKCGLNAAYAPSPAEGGAGTAYILRDGGGKPAAVFKPRDGEAVPFVDDRGGGLERPKLGDEIKRGLTFGEGYLKEAAAFVLDKQRFHNVPPTTVFVLPRGNFVDSGEVVVGSLQKFARHKCSAEDMGWKMFPVQEVHRLGVLDCRILNNDRHLGNILVSEGKDGFYRLTPIDHGMSMPATVSGASFEWLLFPQARQPFDAETLEYIEQLNPAIDAKMLRASLPNLRRECIDTLQFCTHFLKKAARAKFNLYQIGCMMSRHLNTEEPCELEKLKELVDSRVVDDADNATYWKTVEVEMDAFFANLTILRECVHQA